MSKNVEKKVREIIKDELCCTDEALTDDATMESLGADSISMVNMAMTIEEFYDIDLGEEEMLSTKLTVSEIVRSVNTFVSVKKELKKK